jgi:hypothetical protein
MARDVFHFHVREALEKEGWTITHDQWVIKGLTRKISIDLAAESLSLLMKTLSANRSF